MAAQLCVGRPPLRDRGNRMYRRPASLALCGRAVGAAFCGARARAGTPPGNRSAVNQVALFPLGTVLFPDGVLPLRIFEARYMDMVRDCMRREAPFGVCLIAGSGSEGGAAARTASVGCLARIAAWDMEQLGLLHIRTVGGQRFRVLDSQLQPDQLRRAEIELLEPDEDCPI